jgi:hypothetical protein
MSKHEKDVANSATAVMETAQVFREIFCDHQAFFVLVIDEHSGAMPAAENLLKRPVAERNRAADVLRMWAARIESGVAPEKRKA